MRLNILARDLLLTEKSRPLNCGKVVWNNEVNFAGKNSIFSFYLCSNFKSCVRLRLLVIRSYWINNPDNDVLGLMVRALIKVIINTRDIFWFGGRQIPSF